MKKARYAVGIDGTMTFGSCALGLSDFRTAQMAEIHQSASLVDQELLLATHSMSE